jgi:hypothetical protein
MDKRSNYYCTTGNLMGLLRTPNNPRLSELSWGQIAYKKTPSLSQVSFSRKPRKLDQLSIQQKSFRSFVLKEYLNNSAFYYVQFFFIKQHALQNFHRVKG